MVVSQNNGVSLVALPLSAIPGTLLASQLPATAVQSNSGFTYNIQRLSAIVDGTSGFLVPPNYFIDRLQIQNTTASAITGGLKIGTTTGGVDVVAAVAIGANAFVNVPDAALLKTAFSATVSQTLFVQTVTLWNGASVNLTMYCLPF